MTEPRRITVTGGRPATTGVIPGDLALSVGQPSTEPPDGFSWRLLTDLTRLETGHTPSRRHPEYWDGPIPWIQTRDATVNHGRTINETDHWITELGITNSSARLLPPRTVCLSRTASVGFVVIMGRAMATSQDFVNWVCGPNLDFRYLKYILMAERAALLRYAHGTTHQTIYFPEVRALHVLVPPIAHQRAIADILGALDEKIEANLRIVEMSRQLAAHALRAHASGPMVRIGDVADVRKGLSYKGADLTTAADAMPMINLGNFGRNDWLDRSGTKGYSGTFLPRHVVCRGDLLVANTDLTQRRQILGRAVLVPWGVERAIYTHHVFAVIPKDEDSGLAIAIWAALNTAAFRERAEGFATGTTVAGLPKEALLDYEAILPSRHDIDRAGAILGRAWAAEVESQKLAALRDVVLPELLSGRIRVPEARERVEAAV